jgi:hypothetical protein
MIVPMSAPQEAVVEFGPVDEPSPRRRFSSGDFLRGLARDRRIVPLAAGLGAVALVASLIAEWQVTSIDGSVLRDSQVGDLLFESSIGELGAWGGGFLAGLFLLAAATVLALFGPIPGRVYGRLAALSVGGVLLAVVLTVFASLDDRSWAIRQIEQAGLQGDQVTISVGRGPWCAAAGLALVLLALYLSGRPVPFEDAQPPVVEEEEELPDAPFDLTVGPAKPWNPGVESLDKPN